MKSKHKDNSFKFICIPSSTGPLIIPYKVERSSRVKRMHLQVNCPHFVILKLPLRHSELQGMQFLQENGEWVRQKLAAQPRVPRLRDYLAEHPRVALNGCWYRLRLGFKPGACTYLVDDERRSVEIAINPRNPSEEQLIAALRGVALDYLPGRLRHWARELGVKVHGITIRDQKCRWGSCSETGGISLNWRLVLIAPKLQDHVLLHELAHLRHFNHSRAFYNLLHSLDPRAAEHERQLDHEASRVIYLGRVQP